MPVVGSAAFTTYENVAVTGQLSASDAAGNALNYLRVTPPAHGIVTVTPATGAFYLYADHEGYTMVNDSFTFTASDAISSVSSVTATISLTMVALPPAAPAKPVANAAAYPAYEDVAVKAAVTASEAAGDALTYSVSTAPSHGALSAIAADGSFTYTPTAGYIGPDSFSFTASDATTSLVSDPAAITLTVSALPPPGPVAANLSVATYESVTVAGVLPATDGNGNAITLWRRPIHRACPEQPDLDRRHRRLHLCAQCLLRGSRQFQRHGHRYRRHERHLCNRHRDPVHRWIQVPGPAHDRRTPRRQPHRRDRL